MQLRKPLKRNKKGFQTLQQIPIAVLYLVIIGILLVVGLKIMSGTREEIDTEITSFTNQTIDNAFNDDLNYSEAFTSDRISSVSECVNETGEAGAISSDLYTVNPSGRITLVIVDEEAEAFDGMKWNCTGAFKSDTLEYNASTEAMEGLSTVSSYQSLIGLIVIMIAVVLLIIGGFSFFFKGSGR